MSAPPTQKKMFAFRLQAKMERHITFEQISRWCFVRHPNSCFVTEHIGLVVDINTIPNHHREKNVPKMILVLSKVE